MQLHPALQPNLHKPVSEYYTDIYLEDNKDMFNFNRNMNILDRSIRVIVGISLLLIGPMTNIVETDTLSNIILGVLGTTAVLSGTFAYCILYEVTGFNTLR